MNLRSLWSSLPGFLPFTRAAKVPKISATEAARRVTENRAVLLDVREPDEWAGTGVAAPAVLLSQSDFNAGRDNWKNFLAAHRDRELILYCRGGVRAAVVAVALADRGHTVANAGGLSDWIAAGLPLRPAP